MMEEYGSGSGSVQIIMELGGQKMAYQLDPDLEQWFNWKRNICTVVPVLVKPSPHFLKIEWIILQ
jgi:hypothetical protein